jgi:RsiW-degrading membrane proteinase PrsW (M82 family)
MSFVILVGFSTVPWELSENLINSFFFIAFTVKFLSVCLYFYLKRRSPKNPTPSTVAMVFMFFYFWAIASMVLFAFNFDKSWIYDGVAGDFSALLVLKCV